MNPTLLYRRRQGALLKWSRSLLLLALVILLAHASPVSANADENRPFAALEVHSSLFSDLADEAMLAPAFGYGLRLGYRFNRLGVFLHVEQNLWRAIEYEDRVVAGVVNIGVGGEFLYAGGFVRTSFTLGPSILAYDTVLDESGSVGLFAEFRPVGLRWRIHKYLVLGLDPLNVDVVAPVLSGIPLVFVQYRTALYLEGSL